MKDIAGYDEIQRAVQEDVIWPRRNQRLMRGCSRTAGILFYGPPGCGKSRLARAICGELVQEVRLLAPSDLRGLYIGWGQILIREHFDWLFESADRVLLFDEFDAIARSREMHQMHSDEKADVNELLVQFDRAGRLGRMILCTTNFVSSLDAALLRSGRFSDFVPMGPPDAAASAAIISYYLDRLGRDSNRALVDGLELSLPTREDVVGLMHEVIAGQLPEEGWLCGADLEAAVNAAYRVKAREAQDGGASDAREHSVTVTRADLASAISRSRRSISPSAIADFLDDLRAYSPHLLETYQRLLGATGHRSTAPI
jgi:SpoVK/Ycf46/Vps4 family AAA+-type ATPase